MDRHTHHTPAATCQKVPDVARIMIEIEMTRVEVDGMLDRYTARVLDEWLMPLIQTELNAALDDATDDDEEYL